MSPAGTPEIEGDKELKSLTVDKPNTEEEGEPTTEQTSQAEHIQIPSVDIPSVQSENKKEKRIKKEKTRKKHAS